jgi:hypothetical protein
MKTLLMVLIIALFGTLSVTAQKETSDEGTGEVRCDVLQYLDEIGDETGAYSDLVFDVGLAEPGAFLEVYVQLMGSRNKFEAIEVCADLADVKLLTVETFAAMQDLVVLSSTIPLVIQADPVAGVEFVEQLTTSADHLSAVTTALTDEISRVAGG